MAGSREIRCVGPSYQLSDRKAASQRAVNMHLESIDGLGEARQLMLVSAPGLENALSIGSEFRGARYVLSRLFVVYDSVLYELDPVAGVVVGAIATLATSTGFVGMAHNGTQLAMCDGPNLYVLTLATNAFTTITTATNPAWRGSADVQEIDGYAIFVAPNTEQFFISASDDFTSLDALDFSSADSIADNIVAHRAFNSEIWFFGDVSTEVWIDSGAADFPFARYASAPLPIGIVGARAAIVTAGAILWIGKTTSGSGIVYMAKGHAPARVSTTAVEQSLKASADLSSASMWTYQVEGHEFVGINAPGLGTTWVYDLATQQWHERALLVGGSWQPWPAKQVVFFREQHYACSSIEPNYFGGRIYRIKSDVYSNDRDADNNVRPVARERTWPHLVSPSMEAVNYRSLELACMTGYGGVVTLEISNDGGMTFGPPLQCSLGEIGHFTQRVRWHGLGSAGDRVFRLRVSDAVPFSIYDAAVDAG